MVGDVMPSNRSLDRARWYASFCRLCVVGVNMAALAGIAWFVGGCGAMPVISSEYISSQDGQVQDLVCRIDPYLVDPYSGGWALQFLYAYLPFKQWEGQATYIWTPPFDSIQVFRFSGRQPDNPAGPPPFVFSGVPLTDGQHFEKVQIEFIWPDLPPGVPELRGVETLQVLLDDGLGEPSPVHRLCTLTAGPVKDVPAPRPMRQPLPPDGKEDYPYIAYHRLLEGEGLMVPSLCQRYVEALNSGDFVYALQLPAIAVPDCPGAYTFPFASYGEGIQSQAILRNWSGPVRDGFKADLRRDVSLLSCLENSLPQAEGRRWLALVAEPPVTDNCASLSPSIFWDIQVDLFFQQEMLAEHCLTYACYRGDDPQLLSLFSQAAETMGMELTEAREDDCRVLCLGPISMSASATPQMHIFFSRMDMYVQPEGQRVAFQHVLIDAPAAADLAYSCTYGREGIQWGFYGETDHQYDLEKPITQAQAGYERFWLVSEPITGAIPKGRYDIRVTATTESGQQAWTMDFLYIGELRGDLNQDERLDTLDLVLLANALVENLALDANLARLADQDFNLKTDVADLLLLQREVVD